jgi:hypothetical protein
MPRRENELKDKMEKLVDHFIEKGKVYKLRDWRISGEIDTYKELVGKREYNNFVYTARRLFKQKWKTIGEKKPEPVVKAPEPKAKEEANPLDFLRKPSITGESSE